MIHQQRVSNHLINSIFAYTPYICTECGFKTNSKEILDAHKRDWNLIHKRLDKKVDEQH